MNCVPRSGTIVAKIQSGIAGGIIGFVIGPVTGSLLGGMMAGGVADPGAANIGRSLGMVIGGFGGIGLGVFLGGHLIVARWCLGTAGVLGAIGFLAGFAGPIIFQPNSPQGPLLGIFITGPLCFLVGAAVGLGIGMTKERHLAS